LYEYGRNTLGGTPVRLAIAALFPAPSPSALGDASAPRLLHGVIPYPALPALDAPPNVGFWAGVALVRRGFAAFTNGGPAPTSFVVALAVDFTDSRDIDAMLARIGKISALPEVPIGRCGSQWDTLFTRTTSLSSPNTNTRAALLGGEIHSG